MSACRFCYIKSTLGPSTTYYPVHNQDELHGRLYMRQNLRAEVAAADDLDEEEKKVRGE